jgi:hypothetical protein
VSLFGFNFPQNNSAKIPQFFSQLPLENWCDLLAFVPRAQLGQIVPQIGDRQFARIIQAYLHEHGEITLGKIVITRPRGSVPSDRPMLRGRHLPDWPMPGNVKNFEEIDLKFLPLFLTL